MPCALAPNLAYRYTAWWLYSSIKGAFLLPLFCQKIDQNEERNIFHKYNKIFFVFLYILNNYLFDCRKESEFFPSFGFNSLYHARSTFTKNQGRNFFHKIPLESKRKLAVSPPKSYYLCNLFAPVHTAGWIVSHYKKQPVSLPAAFCTNSIFRCHRFYLKSVFK